MAGHNFHPLEVVGRGSETQLQVDENLSYLISRFKGLVILVMLLLLLFWRMRPKGSLQAERCIIVQKIRMVTIIFSGPTEHILCRFFTLCHCRYRI